MCRQRLERLRCVSMEGTLMPQRWEGKRGMDQFAKLQKRRFGVQGGYPCESTVKCWEWAWVVDPELAGQKVGFWWGLWCPD